MRPLLLGLLFLALSLTTSPLQAAPVTSFLYSAGTFTTLKFPLPPYAITPFDTAGGINDSGQIVESNSSASYLDSNGVITQVVAPGYQTSTLAYGINNSGQIVGILGIVSTNGFLDTAGTFRSIDYPGAEDTEVQAINNRGQMVGVFANGLPNGGISFGYFLDDNGVFTQLAIPGEPNVHGSNALGINDAGQIVGAYT